MTPKETKLPHTATRLRVHPVWVNCRNPVNVLKFHFILNAHLAQQLGLHPGGVARAGGGDAQQGAGFECNLAPGRPVKCCSKAMGSQQAIQDLGQDASCCLHAPHAAQRVSITWEQLDCSHASGCRQAAGETTMCQLQPTRPERRVSNHGASVEYDRGGVGQACSTAGAACKAAANNSLMGLDCVPGIGATGRVAGALCRAVSAARQTLTPQVDAHKVERAAALDPQQLVVPPKIKRPQLQHAEWDRRDQPYVEASQKSSHGSASSQQNSQGRRCGPANCGNRDTWLQSDANACCALLPPPPPSEQSTVLSSHRQAESLHTP